MHRAIFTVVLALYCMGTFLLSVSIGGMNGDFYGILTAGICIMALAFFLTIAGLIVAEANKARARAPTGTTRGSL